jgi:hypothetical protein
MTSFYNKYYLTNNNSTSTSTNVLKKDYTLDSTDYEKLKINEQYNKLYSNIYNENKNMIIENENKKIYNLSLAILIKNASTVYINLLNDLSIYFNKENDKSFNKLGYILTKDDNILYIGILFLIISFLLWLINVTM